MSDDDRDNDIESDADKRAHHNALERKRRDHIKDSFSSLRDALPCMAGEKASRAQILKRAAEYIQQMRRKNSAHQQDIEDLRRQNKVLEDQIRSLEKAKATGNYAAAVLEASHYGVKSEPVSAFDGTSESESSDTEQMKNSQRKKLKTGPAETPMRA